MSWWRRLLGRAPEPDRRVKRTVHIDQLARFRHLSDAISFCLDPADKSRVIVHGLPEDIDAILQPLKE